MARLDAAANSSDTSSIGTTGGVPDKDMSSPPVEYGRRERVTTTTENSILATGNFKRRPRQPSILGRPASRARSSSVDSNLAEETGLTNMPRMDNSVLPRGNTRRRPRQPSILGRRASGARSSSIGLDIQTGTPGPTDSALRTGQLKRRARQPSILGTARKDQGREGSLNHDNEEEEDEEDDFNPEDESTPLNLSKTREGVESSLPSSSSINPRKRKLSPLPVRDSSPQLPDDEDIASSSPDENPPSEHPARLSTPEPLSETMAPPQSSSPAIDSPEILPRSRRTNGPPPSLSTRRQPSRKVHLPSNESPPSSPPSLTHSPNRLDAPKRQANPKSQAGAVSTVQLQALLPRRRHRTTRDPYDVESSENEVDVSGLASDEDELTSLSLRPGRSGRLPSVTPARRVSRLKTSSKEKASSKATTEKSTTGVKKTYSSRRTSSDKENDVAESETGEDQEEGLDDSLGPVADSGPENSQELEERVGTELKKAKRKFEVVDKWELEFEDMTAGSSSPWDAR